MTVVLENSNKPCYVLYQRILTLYTSEVFPRRLKLAICRHLGIIHKEENIDLLHILLNSVKKLES